MSNDSNTQDRLIFLEIDGETAAHLQEAWPVIEAALPEILTGFYGKMTAHPVTARILGSASIQGLKSAQSDHWRQLFSGRFDTAYMERVQRVGLTHERIGLEPRWYMGGYAYLLNQMGDVLRRSCGRDCRRFGLLMSAVTKAVILDMELAIESYFRAMRERAERRLEQLAGAFETQVKGAVEVVAGAAGDLRATATGMEATAESTSTESALVAQAALEASASVQTVASAAEELAASIAEISRQAAHSATIAGNGAARAAGIRDTVAHLTEEAGTIGQVVGLIDQIARRTNLLALNASIEAARAGDAGRGFAVVAAEVKCLANQTSEATQRIADRIRSIQGAAHDAAQAVDFIGGIISEIDTSIDAIAAAVEEQGAATAEIGRSVQQAANGTQSVSNAILRVRDTAASSGTTSSRVAAAAEALSRQSDGLKTGVSDFLAAICHGNALAS